MVDVTTQNQNLLSLAQQNQQQQQLAQQRQQEVQDIQKQLISEKTARQLDIEGYRQRNLALEQTKNISVDLSQYGKQLKQQEGEIQTQQNILSQQQTEQNKYQQDKENYDLAFKYFSKYQSGDLNESILRYEKPAVREYFNRLKLEGESKVSNDILKPTVPTTRTFISGTGFIDLPTGAVSESLYKDIQKKANEGDLIAKQTLVNIGYTVKPLPKEQPVIRPGDVLSRKEIETIGKPGDISLTSAATTAYNYLFGEKGQELFQKYTPVGRAFAQSRTQLQNIKIAPTEFIVPRKESISATDQGKLKVSSPESDFLPGQVAAEFIPKSPGEAISYALLPTVLGKVPSAVRLGAGVFTTGLGTSTALDPNLPTEKRVAGGIIAGLGLAGTIAEVKNIKLNADLGKLAKADERFTGIEYDKDTHELTITSLRQTKNLNAYTETHYELRPFKDKLQLIQGSGTTKIYNPNTDTTVSIQPFSFRGGAEIKKFYGTPNYVTGLYDRSPTNEKYIPFSTRLKLYDGKGNLLTDKVIKIGSIQSPGEAGGIPMSRIISGEIKSVSGYPTGQGIEVIGKFPPQSVGFVVEKRPGVEDNAFKMFPPSSSTTSKTPLSSTFATTTNVQELVNKPVISPVAITSNLPEVRAVPSTISTISGGLGTSQFPSASTVSQEVVSLNTPGFDFSPQYQNIIRQGQGSFTAAVNLGQGKMKDYTFSYNQGQLLSAVPLGKSINIQNVTPKVTLIQEPRLQVAPLYKPIQQVKVTPITDTFLKLGTSGGTTTTTAQGTSQILRLEVPQAISQPEVIREQLTQPLKQSIAQQQVLKQQLETPIPTITPTNVSIFAGSLGSNLTRAKVINYLSTKNKAYRVQVRRKGKFLDIGQGLPYGKAVELGTRKTRSTLARTFRLVEKGTTNVIDIKPSMRTGEFRPSRKREPLTFVQVKALSRGTGEVSEILSYKRSKQKRGRNIRFI